MYRPNDVSGFMALQYLVPDPTAVRLVVAALHGAYATGFADASPVRSWPVYEYEILVSVS